MKDQAKHALSIVDPEVGKQQREELTRKHQLRVLQAAREKPKMELEVRKTVARNLFRLLREASARVRTLTVLQKANQCNAGESTKRLPYFVLNPELQGTENEEKRAKLLHKKTANYIKIAQALAELRGFPDNEYILRLFSDTPYASGPSESRDGATDTYIAAFHQLLKEMTEKIVSQHDLTAYFEHIERAHIPAFQLDPEKYWLEHSEAQPLSVLGGGMDQTVFHGGDVGGLPSVALYRGPYGPEIEDRLCVSRRPVATAGEQFPKIKGGIAWEKPTQARVRLWRELRLCICPVAGFLLPQPVFEVRRSILIHAEGSLIDLRRLCIRESGGHFPIQRGDAQFLGRLDLEQDLPVPPEIDVEAGEVFPPIDWTWFARATQAKCKRLLDRPLELDMELAPELATAHPGETGFLADTIGAPVEEAIYDGSLYRLLVRDAERRLGVLEQYVGEREEVLARRRAAARKLWD
jgi:hypothetical protein